MQDDGDSTTINIKGLDGLLRALKEKAPIARVGILGGKTTRSGTNAMTNSEIGALYEFNASGKRPGGSFLRVPITEHLEKYLEKSGAFTKEAMSAVIAQGSTIPWVKKIAVIAEKIVQDAFDTSGFGKWTPSNMLRKKNHQTLVETKQLRESISSEVVDNG